MFALRSVRRTFRFRSSFVCFSDIRLKFDEISINDQLLIRENEDDLQYVFCVEKNDSNREIRVSSQLDHSTDGTNSRWIPISRVLQRQLIVQIDPIQSNSYFSTDEDKLNQKQENFTENFTSTENPPIASDRFVNAKPFSSQVELSFNVQRTF